MLNMTVLLSIAGVAVFGLAANRWGVDTRVDDGRRDL
jgi:hypothetical protein